jgi:hypothetical protein
MSSALRMTPETVVIRTGSLVFNGAFLLRCRLPQWRRYVLARQLIERERATISMSLLNRAWRPPLTKLSQGLVTRLNCEGRDVSLAVPNLHTA